MNIQTMIMIFFCLFFPFILGAIGMLAFVIWSLQGAIDRADICSDDRRFINDVLGIPQ